MVFDRRWMDLCRECLPPDFKAWAHSGWHCYHVCFDGEILVGDREAQPTCELQKLLQARVVSFETLEDWSVRIW